MINETAGPIIITDNLAEDFFKAVDAYNHNLVTEDSEAKHRYPVEILRRGSIDNNKITPDFINALCRVAIANQNEWNIVKEPIYTVTNSKRRLAANAVNSFRRAVKYILIFMWGENQILLPITFSIQNAISRDQILQIAPETLKFLYEYTPQNADMPKKRTIEKITRWLHITDWTSFDKITLDGCYNCAKFLVSVGKGNADLVRSQIGSLVAPRSLMLAAMAAQGKVKFTDKDLNTYDLIMANLDHELEDEKGIENFREILKKRKRDRLNPQKTKEQKEAARIKTKEKKLANASRELQKKIHQKQYDNIIYDTAVKRKYIFPDTGHLSFLKCKLSDKAVKLWEGLMKEFIQAKLRRGEISVEKNYIKELTKLADYLSICVPVKLHELCDDKYTLPETPKAFRRVPFIANAGGISQLPTFLDYVNKVRGTLNTRYTSITVAQKFFQWVEDNYAEEEEIAGLSFRNPINNDDRPRLHQNNPRTNKRPFSAHVLPHLLNYLYCIEKFGIYLQNRNVTIPRTGKINTESYRYVPEYTHIERVYKIEKIPAYFLQPQSGSSTSSMSLLRMIILSLETGIRLQSSQWLCKEKFDRLNGPAASEKDVSYLFVNTNKGSPAFPTPIKKRVRDMLIREKNDQEKLNAEFDKTDEQILYEGREHAVYETLTPLFRKISTGQPFSDNSYSKYWLELLISFQSFFQENLGDELFIEVTKPKTLKIEHVGGLEKIPYCKLNIKPIYTPHSCRSTFITRNALYIEIEDISKIVGHANEYITSTYLYGERDVMEAKRKFAEDEAVLEKISEHNAAINKELDAAYIKANENNSSLKRAFSKNREEAIAAFGIIALESVLQDDKSSGTSGIDLLRSSPISQIKIRPTHICPVGEVCPEEVITKIGEMRRCGLCPYACRSIDHLPGISAKINELNERINNSRQTYQRMKKKNLNNEELAEIYDNIDADITEKTGWELSQEILWDMKENADHDKWHFHVEKPDIIKNHIERVVENTRAREFILKRIIESNEYPTLETPQIRSLALKIKRKILGDKSEENIFELDHQSDAVKEVASILKTSLKIHNLTLEQIVSELDTPTVSKQNKIFSINRKVEEQ